MKHISSGSLVRWTSGKGKVRQANAISTLSTGVVIVECQGKIYHVPSKKLTVLRPAATFRSRATSHTPRVTRTRNVHARIVNGFLVSLFDEFPRITGPHSPKFYKQIDFDSRTDKVLEAVV